METRRGSVRLFNSRPLVRAALGFCFGIFLYEKCMGTWAISLMCLLCACAVFLLFSRRYAALAFLLCALCGMLRLGFSGLLDLTTLRVLLLPLSEFLAALRDKLLDATDALFGAQSPLLRGVLWGDATHMAEADTQAFRTAGVGHVLALSGLHVSFFAGALLFLIPRGKTRLRFFLTGGLLLLYCAIAAFPASLLRASVMTLCCLGAALFQRRNDLPSSLSLAAILILLASPASLFDAGFLLSFGAVAGIAMLLPPLRRLLRALPAAIGESAAVSIAATCGTLPLSAYFFGRVPVYSLLANLLLLPLLPFSIIPAFIAVLLYPLSPLLARAPAFIASEIMELIRCVSHVFASLPMSSIELVTKPPVLFCALCYSLMLACSDFLLCGRRLRFTLVFSLLGVMLFYAFYVTIGA